MKVNDSSDYALFEYEQSPSKYDDFKIGEVVISKEDNGIGIIIQAHGNNEYRTDMFGNCSSTEIRLVTFQEIENFRPNIFGDRNKFKK